MTESLVVYKPGDKVRITNGMWTNAKELEHYGKIATVQRVDQHYVWLHVGSCVIDKPFNEVEPYNVIDRLAALDG